MFRKRSTVAEGFATIFQVASAFFGGSSAAPGQALSALGQAFTSASHRFNQEREGKNAQFDYLYQSSGDFKRDHMQQKSEIEKKHTENEAAVNRLMQDRQRIAEMIASA